MKALHYSLKSLMAGFIVLALLVSSCKEKEKINPDLAAQVAGNYSFTEIEFQGETIPALETSVKGSVKVIRSAEFTVDVDLNMRQKTTNDEFMIELVKGVILSPGNGTTDLMYNGKKVGQIKGDKLFINSVDGDNEPFTLVCTKQ